MRRRYFAVYLPLVEVPFTEVFFERLSERTFLLADFSASMTARPCVNNSGVRFWFVCLALESSFLE